MNDYKIERVIKPSRVLFYPTVNGKRISRTNWFRKCDAKKLLNAAIAKYGEATLYEMSKAK